MLFFSSSHAEDTEQNRPLEETLRPSGHTPLVLQLPKSQGQPIAKEERKEGRKKEKLKCRKVVTRSSFNRGIWRREGLKPVYRLN